MLCEVSYLVRSLVLLSVVVAGSVAYAQNPVATAQPSLNGSAARLSIAERDRLHAELSRDVVAMDRLLGLIQRVVKVITPSVVHIEAQPIHEYRVRGGAREAGSGVIVRFNGPNGSGPQNYILTNRHVIKNSDAAHIRIQFADGRVVSPKRIWDDSYTDVAVMAIEVDGLVPARLGDSDAVEIGEWVLAAGSPFGLSRSVSRGIISAKGRYNLELGDGEVRYQNFLQTDAAINPGNSGGPLINMRGEVIGLNTAIASESGGNEGIGFSIPANIASRIAQELVRTGTVRRGFLGVKLDHLFDDRRARAIGLPRLAGTRIKVVEAGSPAERAQLQVDDVILTYNGVRIEDDEHLVSLVKLTEIGRQVEMTVFRAGQPITKLVQIGNLEHVGASN